METVLSQFQHPFTNLVFVSLVFFQLDVFGGAGLRSYVIDDRRLNVRLEPEHHDVNDRHCAEVLEYKSRY